MAAVGFCVGRVGAQSTVFTYQGQLIQAGAPAEGNFDLRFRLFASATNGTPLTAAVTNAPVAVVNGLFVTTLDFGGALFDGRNLWLEIGVRPFGDTNAHTVLSPRQPLTAMPYALRAREAGLAGAATNLLALLPATNLTGTIPDARLSANVPLQSGGANFVGPVSAPLFTGGGAGLTNLAATNLTGTIPDARLSANVALLNSNAPFAGHVSAAQFIGNGSGLTNVPGALFWTTVPGNLVTAFPNTGYLATNDVTPLTVTLPASPTRIGDTYRVAAVGSAGWIIAQNAGQSILTANLTPHLGTGWTPRDSARAWQAVATSATGQRLVAAVNGGLIYTSTDAGATWTPRSASGSRAWAAVASSADGSKLVGVVNGGFIYTSTDSGASWGQRHVSRAWRAVASSADGNRLVAAVNGEFLHVSANGGVSWTAVLTDAGRSWTGVASSSDGLRLAACVNNGYIHTSSNAGSSWQVRMNSGSRPWSALACSADGQRLAAAETGGQIYLSPDGGASWYAAPPFALVNWTALACSDDGAKLLAAHSSGELYVSTDAGQTWSQRTSLNKNWTAAAVSADGSKMVAVANGDFIYTASATTTTPGTAGYLRGAAQSAITLIYVGNNQFLPLDHLGPILVY